MKNLLNFKRLLSYSHEKQSPQRFGRYAVMLIMLLTLGVGQMWGGTKRVYCKVNNGTWLDAGAKVNVHYWGGSSSTSWPGTSMTASGTANVYYADIPDNSTNFVFARVNPNNSSEYWGHKTSDLSFPVSPSSGLSLYEITGSGEPSSGQWANIGFESTGGNDIKYYYSGNANDQTWDISSASGAGATRDLGTITSLFLKGWDMKMYQNMDAAIVNGTDNRWLYYNIHRSAVSPGDYSSKTLDSWTWPDWSDGYRKPYGSKSCNDNLLTGLGSGKYSMTFYLQHNGLINFYLNNGGSNYNLKWTIGVPAMATHVVTSDGTGSGTDGSPFNMAVGSTLTITVSGTQASSDANSVLYVSFDNGSTYSATTTKSISITNTTKYSVHIKAKYYNSADDLSGTVYDFGDVYYQGTQTPSLAISSFTQDESTVTAANSGSTVTINASRQNAGSATITYAYSTDNSNWTTIASTTSTTQSWTLPAVTSTTTYYVKASMTYESTGYSDTENFKVYGKKTIKVKNTNGWYPFYMHRWGGDIGGTSFPGNDDQISDYGSGQWKQVVLYSSNNNFIFVDGTNNANKNSDQTYAGVTDGGCYEIASGTGELTLNSTDNCPEKPSLTTTSTPSANNYTTATIAGNISSNGNDNITDYGFYWGTSATPGTKVQKGNSNYTGDISHDLTSLTPGTTYYYRAYAANGQGETLGTVYSFKSPYKVTISQSTGCSSISPSGTQYTSGSINLTADAATGYTFIAWEKTNGDLSSAATPSAGRNTVTFTPTSDNATITATYDEDTHSVTVAKDDTGGGNINVTSVTGVGIATASATITATPTNKAWRFWYWEVPSGVTIVGGNNTAASITINATADSKTIIAHFEPRFGLVGSIDDNSNTPGGMPGWNDATSASFTVEGYTTPGGGDAGITVDLQCARTLEPNTRYKFRVYDREKNTRRACSSDEVLPAEDVNNWQLDKTSNDVHIQTVGRGTYTFHITRLSNDDNNYPSLQVERQPSWQVSIGQGYEDVDGNITSNSSTGGTMSAEATESGIKVGITNGLYIANGGKLDFEATPATGYSFEGWHSSSALTSQFADANPSNIASVTAAANVYAKFVENSTAVTISHNTHGHVTVGGVTATSTTVGVTTTRALVAVPDEGYYFAGWTLSDDADFELQGKDNEEDAEVTLHGLGAGTAGTLTANFVEEDKIYFRNIDQSTGNKLWENVYIGFDAAWDATEGGYKNAKGVSVKDKVRKQMEAWPGTNIYWTYVPHDFTKSGKKNVAFFDDGIIITDNYDNLSGCNGAYRTDYSRITNMYVPYHTSNLNTNNTNYYSNGYWKVFDPQIGVGQGYYLQLHTGDDGKGHGSYEQKGEFTAVANGSSKISYTMRVDNTSTQTQYRIASAGGVHYTANATITTAARENVTVDEYKNCDNCYFTVTLTSEGDYTFILDQSEDYMKLIVDYPVSVGDYRLKHTYNDGSDKTTYSNVIKSSDASTSRTLSMYLSTEGSKTLVLQKCTAIVAGVPAWDAGDDTNLSGVLTTVGTNGNGVYKFDVSVSDDKVSSAPAATLYTGPYYIKTDGATGGWVNYTQNGMTENTLNFDAEHPEKSFNYYYCKYYSDAGTNLKCVIANEYCNALTDTLIGDAVIGMGNQTTPSAVSVRFSYNSYTNEIKRSYLGASTTDDFLRVLGNTTDGKPHIYDKDETTYDDSHDDASIKFEDKQNWRYEIVIKADANARAKLTASFNGQTQYFMGQAGESGHEWDDANTEQLFGGAGGTYGLTLVYDFKTNKLIRAWTPTGDAINADLTLNSDVILLREHQGAPTAITFGLKDASNYASLTKVQTVYSVLRFNRWKLNNRAHPEDTNSDHCNSSPAIATHHPALAVDQDDTAGKWLPQAERELYFISFPYDVKMSDIIHFGGYYDKWGIMYYDGKNRAKNGYWIDSESNWKYFTPEEFATGTLNAYEGYLIGIDLDQMRYDNTSFWTNNSSEVDIYFPSKEPVSTITQQEVTVPIDTVGYQCTINRTYGGNDGDRRIKDSHWHCIGVPAYANLTQASTHTGEPDGNTNWKTDNLLYIYSWRPATNDHVISDAGSFTFNAMYAYLVQYSQPTLSWAAAAVSPATPAARRMKTEELRDRQFNLQLMQGDKEADHTYIRLSDDEEVSTGFEFNHDVSKMMLNGANIYTLIGNEQAAANSLPLDFEQTTVVPLGVKIAADGDYTFAIPEGTDGVGVVLIDNISGTRTNLALTDYEVSLTSGKIEDRFVLEISPISQISTDVEAISEQHSDVRKVIVDGMLYIVKDGEIYDARGNRLQ